METNVSRKELYSIALLCAIIFCMSFIMYSYYKVERTKGNECYNTHVEECEQCHNESKTYLLCSGICVEPELSDNKYSCLRIGPRVKCKDSIPKMCLT